MKRILALLALLIATPAIAADNLAVTPGAGASVKMRDSTGSGGPLVSYIIPADLTGTSVWGTAGSANANILTVQGIASMTALTVAQATAANLNATVTQGAAGASPWLVTLSGTNNINNVSGTVSLPTGASTSANQPSAVAAAGAATSGSTGNLAMGAVTTGSPTYTTANTNPLSLDTAGNLRVNVVAGGGAGGTSSTFGSAFPATGTAIGLTSGTNMVAWSATTNYGTAPAAIAVPAVNAFVTNANANGRAVSGSSSPTVLTPALTMFHLIATGTSGDATSVKASATTLYSCQLSNNGTSAAYLKIFNKASAPTLGTDVPVKTLIIPGPAAGGGGSNVIFGSGGGLTLATGFALAVVTGIADNNSTGVAAATFAINCDYE